MMRPADALQALGRDGRQAVRALLARPAYTLGALLSLSLGIGATTIVYSVVSAVLIHAYRYPDADRLVELYESRPTTPVGKLSPGSVARLAERATTLASVSGVSNWPIPGALTLPGTNPQMVQGNAITPGLFQTLRVRPLLGRLFQPADALAGAPHAVLVREQMWRQTFAADPQIIGRTISLDNTPYTVIGVISDHDAFPVDTRDIWVPFPESAIGGNFNTGNMTVVARLAPGATMAQARSQVATIATQISSEYPDTWSNGRIETIGMRDAELRGLRPAMVLLAATVALVLLIACANTANLALSRVIGRERELAVRAALGATRWRIIGTLVTESVMLSLAGAGIGVLVAAWAVPLLRDHVVAGHLVRGIAGWSDIHVSVSALLFTTAVAVATGILFGIGPALHGTRLNLTASLKEGGRGASASVSGQRLRTALVVTQFTFALVLTVGAVLLARSFIALLRTDPGFQTEHVLTLDISIPNGARNATNAAVKRTNMQVVKAVRALPGVRSVAVASFLPLTHDYDGTPFSVVGSAPVSARDKRMAVQHVVTADYFETLGVHLLRGRLWPANTTGDSTPFIVVNQTLAAKYLHGRDPLGTRLKMGWGSAEIIGVVRDTKVGALEESKPQPEIYLPMETQPGWHQYELFARVVGDPVAATGSLRHQIATVDPDIAVGSVRALGGIVHDYLSPWLLMVILLGSFALIALVIAGIGIYGVVSYSVSQRTHELGIRMALGAQGRDVIRLVVRQALVPMLVALPAALVGAWMVARLLSFMLYGVGTADVPTYLLVSFCLFGIAFVACLVPARRAASVAPSVSLRYE